VILLRNSPPSDSISFFAMNSFAIGDDVQTGFWGARTAAVDWCEPNYQHSYYIAEFWNWISSLLISAGGVLFLYHCIQYKYATRFFYCSFGVIFVGLGSAFFHGTLLYVGQVLDELPMVYTSVGFLYCILVVDETKPYHHYCLPIYLTYVTTFTAVYFYIPTFFIFFVILYMVGILALCVEGYQTVHASGASLTHRAVYNASVVAWLGGILIFWLPDALLCRYVQMYKLHSMFHFAAAIGTYLWLIYGCYETEKRRGQRPAKIKYLMSVIPYVETVKSN